MPINVQHDCLRAKCVPSLNAYEIQEREQTQRRTMYMPMTTICPQHACSTQHAPTEKITPQGLTQASPLVADRTQHHQVISKRLQEIITGKNELSRAKRQLTKSLRSGGVVVGKKWPFQAIGPSHKMLTTIRRNSSRACYIIYCI